MKQIKTVTSPIEGQKQFDDAVNALLFDGWKLTRREIINMPGTLSEAFHQPLHAVLYAELEKDEMERPEEVTL